MTDTDSEPMPNSDPDSTDDDQSQFPDPGDGGLVGEDATRYLYWGAFATLLLLALTATVRFYLSASNAIGTQGLGGLVAQDEAILRVGLRLGRGFTW